VGYVSDLGGSFLEPMACLVVPGRPKRQTSGREIGPGSFEVIVDPTAQVPDALGHTSYMHIEPEHLSPSFVWAVRYA